MNQERVFKVLLGPHIFERAVGLADGRNQPVFKVATDAAELETKKAVENLSSVKIQRVTILNVEDKTKRTARGPGKRNNWKKVYTALQPGQDLSFATSAE